MYYSRSEAAERLGMGRQEFLSMVRNGLFPDAQPYETYSEVEMDYLMRLRKKELADDIARLNAMGEAHDRHH